MKFQVIKSEGLSIIEFPLDWLEPNSEKTYTTYYKTDINKIQKVDSKSIYVNVPIIATNITDEEIENQKNSLLEAIKNDGLICKEEDCVHIISENKDKTISHGFAILNAYPSGFAL